MNKLNDKINNYLIKTGYKIVNDINNNNNNNGYIVNKYISVKNITSQLSLLSNTVIKKGKYVNIKLIQYNERQCLLRIIKNKKKFLGSKYIIDVYDIIYYDNSYILIMENMDMDLFDYTDKYIDTNISSKIKYNIIKKILYMIICGIDFIHKTGIIHNDIKSENIVVNIQNNRISGLKIIDFNCAYIVGTNAHEYPKLCSTKYIYSPELYSILRSDNMPDLSKLSYKSDIFSLGPLAYFLYTGGNTKLYDNNPNTDFRKKINSIKNPLLKEFIFYTTKINPNNRPTCKKLLELIKKMLNNKLSKKKITKNKLYKNKKYIKKVNAEKIK